jgi:hypothetical protein
VAETRKNSAAYLNLAASAGGGRGPSITLGAVSVFGFIHQGDIARSCFDLCRMIAPKLAV